MYRVYYSHEPAHTRGIQRIWGHGRDHYIEVVDGSKFERNTDRWIKSTRVFSAFMYGECLSGMVTDANHTSSSERATLYIINNTFSPEAGCTP